MNPNTVLFGGEVFDGRDEQHPLVKLNDGSTAFVRVRIIPARYHLECLELFHLGREADLIQRCCDVGKPGEAGTRTWEPVTAAFVDSLEPESHALLAKTAEEINFKVVTATAQRQITRAEKMGPVMEPLAKSLMAPMRKEFDSWMSSVRTQISAIFEGKKP